MHVIAVAGPYTADTAEQRQRNLDAMNTAAAQLLEKGYIPIIGVNAALPIVEKARIANKGEAIMDISMAVMRVCEGILLLGESPGANRERDFVQAQGFPVFFSVDDIPKRV